MNVFGEILNWASTLPAWQSDAVRRFLTQESMSKQDQDEILGLLKAEHGITDPPKPTPLARPLKPEYIPASGPSRQTVVLKAMHSVKNVNALAKDQRLNFRKGITVIYGDNSAGKSGYSRVLKRACRAREKKASILPNVFSPSTPQPPPEACFEVSVDDKDLPTVKWVDGKASPECLSQIAVFDSQCARVYVDEANEVVYIPYGLEVFPKLATLCNELKRRLESEQPVLELLPRPLLEIDSASSVGVLISKLSHETAETDVEKLATLSQSELERLNALTKTVARIQAEDPKTRAQSLRRQKKRLDDFRDKLEGLAKALSPESVNRLRLLSEDARAATQAAELASRESFRHGQFLPQVGSDVWKEMFLAAKRYSEECAYPGKAFPVTDDGSRCVLCQQILDVFAGTSKDCYGRGEEECVGRRTGFDRGSL